MFDSKNFYFQNFADWHQAITVRCKIDLTPDYIQSRISALQNPKDKSTQEFKSKYGETYLNQVIEWFKQAGQGK